MLSILQSVLAFVLTILALSTVVTIIMEMIVRLTNRRGRVMRHMLSVVFEKEIKTRLGDRLPEDEVEKAIDAVRTSPFQPDKSRKWDRIVSWILVHCFSATESNKLMASDFLRRLSTTEVGSKLVD